MCKYENYAQFGGDYYLIDPSFQFLGLYPNDISIQFPDTLK
jgi:hypothetical protein